MKLPCTRFPLVLAPRIWIPLDVVAGDDISRRRHRAAKSIVGVRCGNLHPHQGIAEVDGTGNICTDEIALHEGSTSAVKADARIIIAGYYVARSGNGSSNCGNRRRSKKLHAVGAVAKVGCAGGIRPDKVSLYKVSCRTEASRRRSANANGVA